MKNKLAQQNFWFVYLVLMIGLTTVFFIRVNCAVALYLISLSAWALSIVVNLFMRNVRSGLQVTIALNSAVCLLFFVLFSKTTIYGIQRLSLMHLLCCVVALLMLIFRRNNTTVNEQIEKQHGESGLE